MDSPDHFLGCTQARSLCKTQNGSILATDPGLFKERFQSCRKFNADFCKSVTIGSLDTVSWIREDISDTPSLVEFSNMDGAISVWTDFKRLNDTHFRSLSTEKIIGSDDKGFLF